MTNHFSAIQSVVVSTILTTGAIFSGCSDGSSGPATYPISGAVTLDGQPLPEGVVYFKQTAAGVVEPVQIRDGKFSGKAPAGKCRVEISSYETKIVDPNGMKSELKTNKVPPAYNTQSTLNADVSASGANNFAFAVTSK